MTRILLQIKLIIAFAQLVLQNQVNSETTKQPKDFFKKNLDPIYLDLPSTNEVLNMIKSLKNKAVWYDNIQSFFSKLPDTQLHRI